MDPAIRSHEPGNDLEIRINRDRSFQELFSEFPLSFRKIVTTVSAGKPCRINGGYGDILICRLEQVHRFFKGDLKIQGFYPTEKFL